MSLKIYNDISYTAKEVNNSIIYSKEYFLGQFYLIYVDDKYTIFLADSNKIIMSFEHSYVKEIINIEFNIINSEYYIYSELKLIDDSSCSEILKSNGEKEVTKNNKYTKLNNDVIEIVQDEYIEKVKVYNNDIKEYELKDNINVITLTSFKNDIYCITNDNKQVSLQKLLLDKLCFEFICTINDDIEKIKINNDGYFGAIINESFYFSTDISDNLIVFCSDVKNIDIQNGEFILFKDDYYYEMFIYDYYGVHYKPYTLKYPINPSTCVVMKEIFLINIEISSEDTEIILKLRSAGEDQNITLGDKMICLTNEWYNINSSGNNTLSIEIDPINCTAESLELEYNGEIEVIDVNKKINSKLLNCSDEELKTMNGINDKNINDINKIRNFLEKCNPEYGGIYFGDENIVVDTDEDGNIIVKNNDKSVYDIKPIKAKGIFSSLKKLVQKVCDGFAKIGKWVCKRLKEGVNLIIQIGEDFYDFIIDSVSKLIESTISLFSKFGILLKDVMKFLTSIFDIKDIISSKNTIKSTIMSNLYNIKNKLTDNYLKELKNDVINLDYYDTNIIQNSEEEDKSSTDDRAFKNNYIINIINKLFRKSYENNIFTEFYEKNKDLFNEMSEGSDVLKSIIISLKDISSDFTSMKNAFKNIADKILKIIKNYMITAYDCMSKSINSMIDVIIQLLNIEIPIISNILDYLFGKKCRFIDVISMIISFPITVIYKLNGGTGPIKNIRDANDVQGTIYFLGAISYAAQMVFQGLNLFEIGEGTAMSFVIRILSFIFGGIQISYNILSNTSNVNIIYSLVNLQCLLYKTCAINKNEMIYPVLACVDIGYCMYYITSLDASDEIYPLMVSEQICFMLQNTFSTITILFPNPYSEYLDKLSACFCSITGFLFMVENVVKYIQYLNKKDKND